jgi:DNA invertase Pin-like site-specific DNA recombinase
VTTEAWQTRRVDLVLLDCGSDPVSANGVSKLFFGILASVAEFEKARIAERMKEGRAGKKERGGHAGGDAPYGYRVEGQGRAAMLVKEPAEQVLIDQMRKLRKRMSLRKLASKLEQEGIRTRAGTAFSAMQIHRILSREHR